MKRAKRMFGAGVLLLFGFAANALRAAEATPALEIRADKVAGQFSPMLYGLMTEEINYSYDGGLYAELIINRTFKDNNQSPVWWHLVQDGGAAGSMSLDTNQPLNAALTTSLKLEVSQASGNQRVGVANEGYWGIPVKPNTRYRASFYARAGASFSGPLTVAITSTNNSTVFASAQVRQITGEWKKYEVTLTTGKVTPTKDANFAIWTSKPGTVWFSMVSLFPPTWNNRLNGNRVDIMQLLADMKPAFLRFPGGNYLEGGTFDTRFNWKITVGDISQRPGHMDDAWRYWSSDGMGLLEFLEWCEELRMQPVLAVYAAYSMRSGAATNKLDECVQDAVDEIEYVTGDTNTKWGAQRAKDGHRKPFNLEYVEIGNEDNLGSGGRTYDQRFTAFHDAIKARYPKLKLISTATSRFQALTRVPDVIDDHYYRAPQALAQTGFQYDNYDRSKPKIFVGEYASQTPAPNRQMTPCLGDALGDAAFLTSLERDSDVVIMSSYAPLFVNVNPGGMQWQTDLIGYDAMTSFGSPSYYVQKIFNLNHVDAILTDNGVNIPKYEYTPPVGRGGRGGATPPQPTQLPSLDFNATRDTKSGTIYLKVVNTSDTDQAVQVKISGVTSIASAGEMVAISGKGPLDTNTINDPTHIIPVTSKVSGLGTSFTRTFSKYSVTVLLIKGR